VTTVTGYTLTVSYVNSYYSHAVVSCKHDISIMWIYYTRRVRSPNGGRRPLHRRATPRSGLPSFSPNCWETGGGWGVGWKWAPIGSLQYQTHMQAPKYDVQFLRSEALRSSSSSSRMRQIKECKIVVNTWNSVCPVVLRQLTRYKPFQKPPLQPSVGIHGAL